MSESIPSSSIRVHLSIENRLLREALVRLFRKRLDLLVVGQTSQADEIPLAVLETQCDVMVGDAFLAGRLMAGFTAYGARVPSCKVVLVGMDSCKDQFITAIRCGAIGYLLQDASAPDILTAVRAAFHGEAVCPPQLCTELFRLVAQMAMGVSLPDSILKPDLTLRQQQLVRLVAKGLTNKEIASQLNLSEFTVRNHIHRILKQVNAASRSEAVQTIRARGYSISA